MIDSMPNQGGARPVAPVTSAGSLGRESVDRESPSAVTTSLEEMVGDVVQLSPEAAAMREEAIAKFEERAQFGPVMLRRISPDQQEKIAEMSSQERSVRSRVPDQINAAGGRARESRISYQKGTDGVPYASQGSLQISVADGVSPEATLVRARQILAVALSGGDYTAVDHSAAAAATQLEEMALMQQSAEMSDAFLSSDMAALEQRIAGLEALAERAVEKSERVRFMGEGKVPPMQTLGIEDNQRAPGSRSSASSGGVPVRRAVAAYAASKTSTG